MTCVREILFLRDEYRGYKFGVVERDTTTVLGRDPRLKRDTVRSTVGGAVGIVDEGSIRLGLKQTPLIHERITPDR